MKGILSGKPIAAAAGIFAAARVASATPVPSTHSGDTVLMGAASASYTFIGETGGGVLMGIHSASYNGYCMVGEFIMNTSNPNFQSTIKTYCTDVDMELAHSFNYTLTPLSSATGFAPVWKAGGMQNAAKLWYNGRGTATTSIQTAGLQLAIWELLYNGLVESYSASIFSSPGNGGFYITSTDAKTQAVEAYAAGALNNLGNLPAVSPSVEWLAPTRPDGQTGGSQGLLYALPPVSAPEATSTLEMLGLAVVVLGVWRNQG